MKNMREDRTGFIYLNKYEEYTKEDIVAIIDDLFMKAGHLTNPKLVFESTIEPYEDYPGDVEVYVQGMRPATKQEIEEDQEQEELYKLAKEMGITVYEARTIQDLKESRPTLLPETMTPVSTKDVALTLASQLQLNDPILIILEETAPGLRLLRIVFSNLDIHGTELLMPYLTRPRR